MPTEIMAAIINNFYKREKGFFKQLTMYKLDIPNEKSELPIRFLIKIFPHYAHVGKTFFFS